MAELKVRPKELVLRGEQARAFIDKLGNHPWLRKRKTNEFGGIKGVLGPHQEVAIVTNQVDAETLRVSVYLRLSVRKQSYNTISGFLEAKGKEYEAEKVWYKPVRKYLVEIPIVPIEDLEGIIERIRTLGEIFGTLESEKTVREQHIRTILTFTTLEYLANRMIQGDQTEVESRLLVTSTAPVLTRGLKPILEEVFASIPADVSSFVESAMEFIADSETSATL